MRKILHRQILYTCFGLRSGNEYMAAPRGIEPLTCCLEGRCKAFFDLFKIPNEIRSVLKF